MDEQELLDLLERQNQLLERDNRAVSFQQVTHSDKDGKTGEAEKGKGMEKKLQQRSQDREGCCSEDRHGAGEKQRGWSTSAAGSVSATQSRTNCTERAALPRSASVDARRGDSMASALTRGASTSSTVSSQRASGRVTPASAGERGQSAPRSQQAAPAGGTSGEAQQSVEDAEVARFALWTEILGSWQLWYKKKQRRLQELLYEGVPSALRCVVWQHLARSQEQANAAAAARLHTDNAPSYAELIARDTPHEKLIRQDLARTFPKHSKFKDKEGDGQEVLFNVMKAYSLYDTEVGYCQGSAFIVAILLMHMPEEEAFDLFIILMRDYKLRGMFKPSMADLPLRLHQFDALTSAAFPDLHTHFQDLGLSPSMYASQWFLTAFTSSLHTEAAFRLFDVFLLEGLPLLFKAALAVLQTNHNLLHRHNFDGVMSVLGRNGLLHRYEGVEDELMRATRAAPVTSKQLQRYEKQYREQEKEEAARNSELAHLRSKCKRLEEKNSQLQAKLELLEGEYSKLAKKHLDVSVQLHQRDEEALDLRAELKRRAAAQGVDRSDGEGERAVAGMTQEAEEPEASENQGEGDEERRDPEGSVSKGQVISSPTRGEAVACQDEDCEVAKEEEKPTMQVREDAVHGRGGGEGGDRDRDDDDNDHQGHGNDDGGDGRGEGDDNDSEQHQQQEEEEEEEQQQQHQVRPQQGENVAGAEAVSDVGMSIRSCEGEDMAERRRAEVVRGRESDERDRRTARLNDALDGNEIQ